MATALDWIRGFALTGLDTAAAAGATERLRQALAAHLSDDGVWFDSSAWTFSGTSTGNRLSLDVAPPKLKLSPEPLPGRELRHPRSQGRKYAAPRRRQHISRKGVDIRAVLPDESTPLTQTASS